MTLTLNRLNQGKVPVALCEAKPRILNTRSTNSSSKDLNSDEHLGTPVEKTKELSSWDKFRSYFKNSPKPFKIFRDSFTLGLNALGVVLNFSAVIGKGIPWVGPKIQELLDKKSEWFSRYVVPLSFAWNSVEAAAGNRLIESAARLIPAVLFWVLPFYNFNMATGISSGINYLLHLIDNRYDGKTPNSSPKENLKATWLKFKELVTDFGKGKVAKGESAWDIFAVAGMLLGSTGGLAFAKEQRDSWAARIFGLLRNAAGFAGDGRFVIGNDVHKRIAGASMMFASIANIFMRWVGDDVARVLNHLAVALDDFGLTYWAHESKRRNDAASKEAENLELLHRGLGQAAAA